MFNFTQTNKSKIDSVDSNHLSLEKDVNPVINKYYPALLDAVHASLSVFATLSLKNRTKPLSLIFEASSGFGKSAVLQMAFPYKSSADKISKLADYAYRSDKFTPKSFVSHAANKSKKSLAEVDLLPRLENKVLITKELAPIFQGREQEKRENFSILIAVLDGKGFTSDSGTMGQRGYQRNIIFNWLGATTPLSIATHRMMSQLGTRLLFFEISSVEPTDEELFAYAASDNVGKAEIDCNITVNNFLIDFFQRHPVGSMESDSIVIPKSLSIQITLWAKFLVKGRAEIKYDEDDNDLTPKTANKPEGAWKVIDYFKELARGHALIHDRMEVNSSDIDFISHVAISSVPIQYRALIRELRKSEYVTSSQCANMSMVSQTTARRFLSELSILGIAKLIKGTTKVNAPDKICLSDEFIWMKINNKQEKPFNF